MYRLANKFWSGSCSWNCIFACVKAHMRLKDVNNLNQNRPVKWMQLLLNYLFNELFKEKSVDYCSVWLGLVIWTCILMPVYAIIILSFIYLIVWKCMHFLSIYRNKGLKRMIKQRRRLYLYVKSWYFVKAWLWLSS